MKNTGAKVMKMASVKKEDNYRIYIEIGELNGKFAYAVNYRNGYCGMGNGLISNTPECCFRYNSITEVISAIKNTLLSETKWCLDPVTISSNACKYTQQMYDEIIEQLDPQQLDLFGGLL